MTIPKIPTSTLTVSKTTVAFTKTLGILEILEYIFPYLDQTFFRYATSVVDGSKSVTASTTSHSYMVDLENMLWKFLEVLQLIPYAGSLH